MVLKYFFYLVVCLTISSNLSYAGSIEAIAKNSVFYAPRAGYYVETDLMILGNSIAYMALDSSHYKGTIEVLIAFKVGDKIVKYDKYLLNTVTIADTNNISIGIIDKKRYPLAAGEYVVDINLTDVNNLKQKHIAQHLTITGDTTNTRFSDITLVDKFQPVDDANRTSDGKDAPKEYCKSGLYMEPMVLNYFTDNANKLVFYAEAYTGAALRDSQLLVTFAIQKEGAKNPNLENFAAYKKIINKPVMPIVGEFNITALPSGNYNLALELKSRTGNTLCTKSMFFQRTKIDTVNNNTANLNVENSFVKQLDEKTLRYQIRTLIPITGLNEQAIIKNLLKSTDLTSMRQFLLYFWYTRNTKDPYAEWLAYAEKVKLVNARFGTTTNFGFETERGRVYLTYGPPNQLNDFPREPGAYPYQIWQYYSIPRQGPVKFVFYNHDLATNDYELIHSTATNETRNEQWQRLVYQGKGTVDPNDYGTQVQDHYGSKASENFTNP